MKKAFLIVAAVIAAIFSSYSCQKDESMETESADTPIIKAVTPGEVVIPYTGGTAEFLYTIENPVENGQLSVSVPDDASWIISTDLATEGKVLITAAPNPDTVSRYTALTLKYESASMLINVAQNGTDGASGHFLFNILDLKTTSVTVEVYPRDKEQTYIALTVEKSYMDKFESEEEFFLDDLSYLQSMADEAGVTLSTFLSQEALRTGDSGPIEFRNLKQDTEYYAYAYGLSSLGVKMTSISRELFRTRTPGSSDLTLELSVEVESNNAVVKATPTDPDMSYYVGVLEADDCSKFYGGKWPEAASLYLVDVVWMMRRDGLSLEEVFAEISRTGYVEEHFDGLFANEKYYAFACPVDEECNVIGDVAVEEFVTGSVPGSDNVISFEPSEIGVNYAYIDVIPSNDDPFVALLRPMADYEDMDGEQIIASVMDYYGDNIIYMVNSGPGTLSDTDLEEKTEYMAFAFGLSYGQASTQLFKYVFSTLEETDPTEVTFEFAVENVYERGADVYVYPDPVTSRYYWNLVEGNVTADEAEALVLSDYEYYADMGYVSSLQEYMSMVSVTGPAMSGFSTLDSDTEYKPFAVGIYPETGEFATEVFFGDVFRTKVLTFADVHVTISAEDYYDGTEVASMYPVYYEAAGMAVLPVSVSADEGSVHYYYHMFAGDMSDPALVSDERVTDELYSQGIMDDPYYIFYGYWNETVTLMGVAEDADGNFGPVTRKVMTFSRDGISDISGFRPEEAGMAPRNMSPVKMFR